MDNAVQIIASPNKTNISLGLCKVPTHHMNCLDWIVQHATDKGSTMLPILIYCQSLKSVGRVFSYLKAELQGHAWVGCDPDCRSENLLIGMFHSKTLPQNKQRVLASLRGEGNCRIVVSTTPLEMGLNFVNVSHVVMYGGSRWPRGDFTTGGQGWKAWSAITCHPLQHRAVLQGGWRGKETACCWEKTHVWGNLSMHILKQNPAM